MTHVWTVQVRPDDTAQWRDALVTYRSIDAIRTYHDTAEPKRLLRNGKALRIRSTDEQLDLFNEEEDGERIA